MSICAGAVPSLIHSFWIAPQEHAVPLCDHQLSEWTVVSYVDCFNYVSL